MKTPSKSKKKMNTYVLQKTVRASSAEDAILLDKKTKVHECVQIAPVRKEMVADRIGFQA
jgi:hypothetical protein